MLAIVIVGIITGGCDAVLGCEIVSVIDSRLGVEKREYMEYDAEWGLRWGLLSCLVSTVTKEHRRG